MAAKRQMTMLQKRNFPWRDLVILAALMLAYTLAARNAVMNLDTARDTRIALAILDGSDFPLVGPLLAGQIHLGPGWYYLLAVMIAMGGGWLGATTGISALASLQFVFAYLLGRAWQSREAGLLWAAFLILPSWSTFEQFYPTHTQLTAATVLASLLFLKRFSETSSATALGLVGLGFSIALHAHPSAVILIIPIVWALLGAYRLGTITPKLLAVFVIAVGIPFVPLLIDQWTNGFTLFGSVTNYMTGEQSGVEFGNIPSLARQIGIGGIEYLTLAFLGLEGATAWALIVTAATLFVVGLSSFTFDAIQRKRTNLLALLVVLMSLLLTVCIRKYYPYYMTTAVHVLFLGVVASGLARLLESRSRVSRVAVTGLCVACLISFAMLHISLAGAQRLGKWPAAIFPLFDVKGDWSPVSYLPVMTSRDFAASGGWLCAEAGLSLHGGFGVHLLYTYASETRFMCPSNLSAVVAGNDPERQHWLGVSRAMLGRIQKRPARRVGGFGLVPVARVLSTTPKALDPNTAGYPPVDIDPAAGEARWTVQVRPDPGKFVVITNLAYFFFPSYRVRVVAEGAELAPIAQDWTTKVYYCEACTSQPWDIEFFSSDQSLIDIVSF